MELVDILAQELKEWPDDYLVETITQDVDCMVFGWSEADPEMDEGYWVFSERSKLTDWRPGEFAMAEDRNNALVTRAQWQAAVHAVHAVDAPKAGERTWDGEGVPPVGAMCIIEDSQPHPAYANHVGKMLKIVGYDIHPSGDLICVYRFTDEEGQLNFHGVLSRLLHPVRTAEQIAAEERAAEVAEMINLSVEGHQAVTIAQARILCTQLHKAGYRKQVQP